MPDFSVVTIVKGRRKQLANLLDSIGRSTLQPNDIQIVAMDDPADIVAPSGLTVETHTLESGGGLPLAAARNRGISAARTDTIIFIDVDCIVSPTLFEHMLAALQSKTVVAAYPLYLPFVPENGSYQQAVPYAVPHPARKSLPTGVPVDHLQFWSLIFAIHKQSFELAGGFDETFTGYGAEDTDFAMSFNAAGITQIFVQDYVLHQYHHKYDPPLNHFDAIIRNAERFHDKWHILPMRSWLRAFEALGLITISPDDMLTVRRKPTEAEITARISDHPY